MIAARTTSIVSAELARDFEIGDGLLVARWNGFGPANVEAIGVVVSVTASKECTVEWVQVKFDLPELDSSRPGSQFWKQKKPTFTFVPGVAEEFGLWQCFARHMLDPLAALRGAVP